MSRPPVQALWLAQRELPDLGTRCVCCDADAGDQVAAGVWHRDTRFPTCAACTAHAVDDSEGAAGFLGVMLVVFLVVFAVSVPLLSTWPGIVLAAGSGLIAFACARAVIRHVRIVLRNRALPDSHHPALGYFCDKRLPRSRITTTNPALAARLRDVIDTSPRSRS